MIIELPPVFAYDAVSEILSEDLFLPALDDDEEYDMDGVAHKRNGVIGMRGNLGFSMGKVGSAHTNGTGKMNAMESGMLSDAEFMCTSTSASESELEPYVDSGLESDTADAPAAEIHKKLRSRAIVTFAEQHEREIALHSPGKLLNTPRDSARRYEYPFPSGSVSTPSDSPASTPAVSPLLIGTPSPASSSMSVNSINLILAPPETAVPRTAPIPIPFSPPQAQAGSSRSAATSSISAPHAHPKLLKFKPEDVPIPPSLRSRSIVIDNSAVPHAMRSLPPTPTKPVTNPLEGKRSRSQEPEPGPSIIGVTNAPPLRKAVTSPAAPQAQPFTTVTCTQRTPDSALAPLPELSPLSVRHSQTPLPDSPTLSASPKLMTIDTVMDHDLERYANSPEVTLPVSSSPLLSPAPTIICLHPDDPDPDLIDLGTNEHMLLGPGDEDYTALGGETTKPSL